MTNTNYYRLKINCLNMEMEVEKTLYIYVSCDQVIESDESGGILAEAFKYINNLIPDYDSYSTNIGPIPDNIKRRIINKKAINKIAEFDVDNKHIILYQ